MVTVKATSNGNFRMLNCRGPCVNNAQGISFGRLLNATIGSFKPKE